MSVLPTFLGIGVQRAGTTWLHNCLDEHPEVFVPLQKELRFFNREFDRGVDWYSAHFMPAPGHRAVGEITPNYLERPDAVPRMAAIVPDARLFVVLREPAARAYSAYTLLRQKYGWQSFQDALAAGETLIDQGMYYDQLVRLYRYYSRDQVRVYLYDDLERDPRGLLRDLFEFIGVDNSFVPPSCKRRYNRVLYPRTQKVLSRFGAAKVVDVVKRSPIGEYIKRRHTRSHPAEGRGDRGTGPSRGDVAAVRARFREDVQRLEKLIGRDLSAWQQSS